MGSSVYPPAPESAVGPRGPALVAGLPRLLGRAPLSVHVWSCRGLVGVDRVSHQRPGCPLARRHWTSVQFPVTHRARAGPSACPARRVQLSSSVTATWSPSSVSLVRTGHLARWSRHPLLEHSRRCGWAAAGDCPKTRLARSAVPSPRRHLLKEELGRPTETVRIRWTGAGAWAPQGTRAGGQPSHRSHVSPCVL